METSNPLTVGQLLTLVQTYQLPYYSEGAQMALASAVASLLKDSSSGINKDTELATDQTLNAIYNKLGDEGRTSGQRLIWAFKSRTGNPTEEALRYIDSFAK